FSYCDVQRLPTSVTPEMEGAFRTPMLRCVNERPSFMHTGHMRTLQEVVEFFNRGGDRGGFPGTSVLKPLNLSDEEVKDVVHFMEALEGPGPSAEWLKP
nr:hypothetical protein [Polyangiaceae bacterium]